MKDILELKVFYDRSTQGASSLFVHGLILAASIILTLLIGLLRFLTGPEYTFSLLFFIPIVLTCWFVGKKSGNFIALVSATTWLVADMSMADTFSGISIPIINESFRLVVFLFGVHLLSKLKSSFLIERELVLTDTLTGINNRRGFHKFATLELERSRPNEMPFSVLFYDIDDFKRINDLYGRQTGESLLCSVAETGNSNIRSIDIFARLGGDEFVLLLSGAGRNLAYVAAKNNR